MGSRRGQGVDLLIPILLDTDLGAVPTRTAVTSLRDEPEPAGVGPVDDELALALLWGSPTRTASTPLRGAPEPASVGPGDTALRARIVEAMAVLAHRPVTVAPGRSAPLSGREVWWAGHEGDADGPLPPGPPDAATWAQPSPGALLLKDRADGAHILAISPLGSVADALEVGLEGLAGVTVMGGDRTDPTVGEHNLASDSAAARRVLTSGLPITALGVDITRQVRFEEPEIARFAACGRLGEILALQMCAWMARWDEAVEVPHDPLTALAILEPELFTFAEPCAVTVSDGSDGPEGAVRRLDEAGTVRVATAVDATAARRSMADRIAVGLGEQQTLAR